MFGEILWFSVNPSPTPGKTVDDLLYFWKCEKNIQETTQNNVMSSFLREITGTGAWLAPKKMKAGCERG